MCGIVGYIGNKNAKDVLLEGLRRLEYRGYDSAGITVLKDNELFTVRSVGKLVNLENKLSDELISNVGIGHTRWATHGGPNEDNCHPHKACRVTLVHNGIIENYLELKKELIEKGYKFKSETDTEVAAALIDSLYNGNKIETLTNAMNKIRGSYAFSIIFEDDYDTLYALRKASPLLIGVGNDENFIASSTPAFLKYTDKFIDLEEEVIAVINKEDIKLYKDKKEIEKVIKTEEFGLEAAEKNGYDHFMLKEMNEQPEVLEKVIGKYITNDNLNDQVLDLSKYTDIHIVACGSAYHAGLVGKYLLNNYANTNDKRINVMADVASEYRYTKQLYNDETLVVLISQSGETADTLACLKMAKENNVDTLAIVNVQSSSIARESKYVMPILAGPEIAVATTKGYFAQVALLSNLALKLCDTNKTIDKKDRIETITELKSMSDSLKTILSKQDEIKEIANNIYNHDDIFFIGRGLDYVIGLEGSLKLKEISYINSNTYQAGELKHGPIALINEGTPVIALCTNKDLMEKTISNIKEVKSRGAYVVLLTNEEIDNLIPKENSNETFYNDKVVVPKSNDFNQTLSAIIPLQMLSYEVAKLRDCDIDKPKNLAKSVTVE